MILCMSAVKIVIADKDKNIAAMIKALALEVGSYAVVRGATKDFLQEHGCLYFNFFDEYQADKFRTLVRAYVPSKFAQIHEPKAK